MKILRKFLFVLGLIFIATNCLAQNAKTLAERQAAVDEANKVTVAGPSKIELSDQATLSLPEGYNFVPAAAAMRIMRAGGNTSDEKSLLGFILPAVENDDWLIVVRFKKDGYVRDDDARDWKADDMLKSLHDGTEQVNAARKERGIPEIEVTGWAEVPAYDPLTHRMIWSAIGHHKDQGTDNTKNSVNYQTLVLGRDGYLTLTMITKESLIAADKPIVNKMLAAIDYHNGKRYEDFAVSTDHVAEYGLTALVVGVAAKKIGLIAVIAAFVAKFFKIGLLAVVAFGAAIKRFFKRTPKPAPPAPASNPDEPYVSPFEPRQLTQPAPDLKTDDRAAEAGDTANRV